MLDATSACVVEHYSTTPRFFDLGDEGAESAGEAGFDQAGASIGGVWEATGRRAGHNVSWRVSGRELELLETSLLPGVELHDREIRIKFSAPLLPAVGVALLPDDSLLVSAAEHAAGGGVHVFQLRFELGADAPLVRDAVVPRASWFSTTPETAHKTRTPVATSLGRTACTAAFSAKADVLNGRARSALVLGGDSAVAVHVVLTNNLSPQSTEGILAAEAEAPPPASPPPAP